MWKDQTKGLPEGWTIRKATQPAERLSTSSGSTVNVSSSKLYIIFFAAKRMDSALSLKAAIRMAKELAQWKQP